MLPLSMPKMKNRREEIMEHLKIFKNMFIADIIIPIITVIKINNINFSNGDAFES